MEKEKSTEEIERKDASIISKFQRGIVYETRADFPNSVFNKVYKRAYAWRLLRHLVIMWKI